MKTECILTYVFPTGSSMRPVGTR